MKGAARPHPGECSQRVVLLYRQLESLKYKSPDVVRWARTVDAYRNGSMRVGQSVHLYTVARFSPGTLLP
jgi:hypothetical protein